MKVLPFEISKPDDGKLMVQVDQELVFFDKLHQHKELQLSVLINGSGKLIIGDSIHHYKTGDFFVIGSQVPHLFQSDVSDTYSHMISLFFTPDSFGQDFFQIPDLSPVAPFFKMKRKSFKVLSENETLKNLMLQITKEDKLNRFLLFLKLLQHISNSKIETLTGFENPKALNLNEGKRLQDVFNYVMKNFDKTIKLETAASLAFMTPNAFCRFFKQRTDKSFFQFLIELRIAHACQILRDNKDTSILEASEKSGFKSISNFNRKFKALKGFWDLKVC